MREQRELQTLIDQLERYIKEQAEQIDSLHKTIDALVIACEQANAKLKVSAQPEQKRCECIDQFWCATFDRCKRNE